MDADKKALWVDALRSGEYEQGQGWLNMEGKFCCLGVLCEVAVKNGLDLRVKPANDMIKYATYGSTGNMGDGDAVFLPPEVARWAGMEEEGRASYRSGDFKSSIELNGNTYTSLAHLNDEGNSFEVIADVIEDKF